MTHWLLSISTLALWAVSYQSKTAQIAGTDLTILSPFQPYTFSSLSETLDLHNFFRANTDTNYHAGY